MKNLENSGTLRINVLELFSIYSINIHIFYSHGSIEFNSSFSPGIGLITLHNSNRHNALSGKMMAELADVIDKLENITQSKTDSKVENELVALILSGNGNTFCSGLGKEKLKNKVTLLTK